MECVNGPMAISALGDVKGTRLAPVRLGIVEHWSGRLFSTFARAPQWEAEKAVYRAGIASYCCQKSQPGPTTRGKPRCPRVAPGRLSAENKSDDRLGPWALTGAYHELTIKGNSVKDAKRVGERGDKHGIVAGAGRGGIKAPRETGL